MSGHPGYPPLPQLPQPHLIVPNVPEPWEVTSVSGSVGAPHCPPHLLHLTNALFPLVIALSNLFVSTSPTVCGGVQVIYLAYVYDLMQCNVIDLLWSTLERIRTCSVSHIDHPVPVGGQTGGEGDDSVLRRLTDGCGSAASVIFLCFRIIRSGNLFHSCTDSSGRYIWCICQTRAHLSLKRVVVLGISQPGPIVIFSGLSAMTGMEGGGLGRGVGRSTGVPSSYNAHSTDI